MKTLETRTVRTAGMLLNYTLLEQEGRYSVSVRKGGETALIADLTTRREKAEHFFAKIVRGTVTPISLREVAEDYVVL